MKNENDKVRAFAIEVIEWIEQCENSIFAISSTALELKMLADFKKKIKSLLPKEEEVDWSKASLDAKLEYASKIYKKGTVIKGVDTGEEITLDSDPIINGYNIATIQDWVIYSNDKNKWAEIVEPETKTESNYEKQLEEKYFSKTESDEVKVGEECEVSDDGINFDKYAHHKHRYNGAKRFYDGHFITENQDGFIATHKFIRKPQPTIEQKARKKAEEIADEWRSSHIEIQHFIQKALLIDPKTL